MSLLRQVIDHALAENRHYEHEDYSNINWVELLESHGFTSVKLASSNGTWQEMHVWCVLNIGKDNYTWTGNTFWFEHPKDAEWFALKWLS